MRACAQDLNGVTRQLLLSQPHYKVLVGDPHQHICERLGWAVPAA